MFSLLGKHVSLVIALFYALAAWMAGHSMKTSMVLTHFDKIVAICVIFFAGVMCYWSILQWVKQLQLRKQGKIK